MCNYEIVFMVYCDKYIYINDIIEYYKNIINLNGKFYKFKNLGLKKLSYNIKNNSKAYYVLINFKINKDKIKIIHDDLKINNNILRFLIIKKNI